MNLAKLKGLRVEHGFTQKEMAQKMNIGIVTYTLKENGKRDFSSKELAKLCEILNVEASVFF